VTTRPFRVLGVQQIAIGALDRQRLHRLWVDLLGLEMVGSCSNAAENVDEEILRVGGLLGVEVDLMQPLDPSAKPRVQEPALNHVGLWVDDLRAAHAWLSAQGVGFAGGIRAGAHGHDVCFIHPKQGGEGVLIELVQAPPEVVEAFDAGARR
jgi:lactoylglutathione lyase